MQVIMFSALVQAALPTVDITQAGAQLVGSGADRFGYQSAAGDLDGDGKQDLVVTAPHQIGGNAVYVFFGPLDLDGSTTLDVTMADVAIVGGSNDETGWSVTVGDVMGDETVDLVIGSPSDANTKGTVQIFEAPLVPGDYSTLDATHTVTGAANGDEAGWSVAAGDFDGDGVGELAIGACGAANGNGRAFLLDLDTLPTSTSSATATFGTLGRTGCSMANIGDFNGDDIEDLAIGSYGTQALNNRPFAGGVSIVYGRAAFASTYDLRLGDPVALDIARIRGEQVNANFGYDIAPAGDLNFDGCADMLIGAPAFKCTTCPGAEHRGRVYLVLGAPDSAKGGGSNRALYGTSEASAVADLTYEGAALDDWTGVSVAGAGWVGETYGNTAPPWVVPSPVRFGRVMLLGTGVDEGYAIPYDSRARLAQTPKYVCKWTPDAGVMCTLQPVADPDAVTPRQIVRPLATMSYGGTLVRGDAGSAFGLEVLGTGDLDGDHGGDLFFGAPHQRASEDAAGDGEAYVFASK